MSDAARVALLVGSDAAGSDAAGPTDVGAVLQGAGWEVRATTPAAAGTLADDDAGDLADVARVVAAGGDGTVAAAAHAADLLGVPLAVVPLGTANDLARAMELPRDPGSAARLAASAHVRCTDLVLGDLDGRAVVNVVSVGASSDAAARAGDLKDALGAAAYPAGAALVAAGGGSEPVHARIELDGRERWSGDTAQLFVAASGAFGGMARVGADSGPLLAVVAAPADVPRIARIAQVMSLVAGTADAREDVFSGACRTVRITLGEARPVVVDGELLPERDELVVRRRERPVRLVVAAADG